MPPSENLGGSFQRDWWCLLQVAELALLCPRAGHDLLFFFGTEAGSLLYLSLLRTTWRCPTVPQSGCVRHSLMQLTLWYIFCQVKFRGTLTCLTGTVSHKQLLRRNVLLWKLFQDFLGCSLVHLLIICSLTDIFPHTHPAKKTYKYITFLETQLILLPEFSRHFCLL